MSFGLCKRTSRGFSSRVSLSSPPLQLEALRTKNRDKLGCLASPSISALRAPRCGQSKNPTPKDPLEDSFNFNLRRIILHYGSNHIYSLGKVICLFCPFLFQMVVEASANCSRSSRARAKREIERWICGQGPGLHARRQLGCESITEQSMPRSA